MSRCKLEEFISYEQPAKYIVDSDQYDDSYETPVLTAGKSFILGYTDEKNNIFDNLPVIIFDDFTTSVQFVDFPFKVKSSAMKLLKNTEQADIKYCYYLLKFLQHTPENHKRQWLSATSQNIVELPTIEKQKNIVMKLDKILEVIDNQNKQLELLDEAIKARFVEMFGDPITNDMLWNTVKLNDVCYGIGDGLHGTPEYDEYGDYPFINGNNLKNGMIEITPSTKMVNEDIYRKYFIKLTENTILLSINGTLGNLALYNGEKVVLGKSACYCNLIPDINRIFVCSVMKTDAFSNFLESNATSSTIKNIGLKVIREFELIVPPLELQNQFASFVEEIDKSRSRIQKSLEASQELFDSLMQEYFG